MNKIITFTLLCLLFSNMNLAQTQRNSTQAFASIRDYGARGNGKTDDTLAIQKALDTGDLIVLPKGIYRTTKTLIIRSNNTVLMGHGPYATILAYEGTGPAIMANASTPKTLYWCGLRGMRIEATNKKQTGPIIKWTSMQFGSLEDLWLAGNGNAKTIGISLAAVPGRTEATYNKIVHNYIGLVQTGIQFGYGTNSNTIEESRIQPVTGGVGVYLQGEMSNNRIINSGFEYPGRVSGGILIDGKVHNTFIQGNRFESLAYGWKVNDNANSTTVAIGNYYDSITSKSNWLDNGIQTQNFDQTSSSK
jgi:hypothetical protein